MPTVVLESSWKKLKRGNSRGRSIQYSLQQEIEHRLTDGFHHRKEKCNAFLIFCVSVMLCESVALRNLGQTGETE